MIDKNKKDEPFVVPSFAEVTKVVDSIDIPNKVAKLVHKSWQTIDRWCNGPTKIDFANWKLLNELSRKSNKNSKKVGE